MISYVHFPVIAVMGLFLAAFLIEIFGSKNALVRNFIFGAFTALSTLLIFALIKPVFIDGEVISYWMGNWEPEAGYAIGIGYEIDGLSLFFALLVVTTFFLSGIYSIKYMERDRHLGHFYTLFLMLSGAVLGLVLTGDVFNMFVMIEIITFATVALTAFRNDRIGSLEAGFKYLVLGSMGAAFTLTGIACLYASCHTLNMAQISAILADGWTPTTVFAFALMIAGLSIESYLVPFHNPAADVYTTAPSSVSMLFPGMVNKAGVYALLRLVYTIFRAMDRSSMQLLLTAVGTLTMFIGVTMALKQHNFKRLLAFHSISQVGYIVTAMGLTNALGIYGGLFHAMNHTLFKGLLFLCAGALLYANNTTDLDRLGGLSKKMPVTTVCFLVGAFSISGIPPFNGFASKWLIYQAAYDKALTSGNFFYMAVTVIAVLVSVMTLASFIKVAASAFFGQLRPELAGAKEVPVMMQIPMILLSAACLVSGIFYDQVMDWVLKPAVVSLLDVTKYINTMMGKGYAALHSAANIEVPSGYLSLWDPMLWLLLFVIGFIAISLVIVLGDRERGRVEADEAPAEDIPDGKYATFFGGEKAQHSHLGGSDLFWGFKKNWKGYFKVMDGLHSGSVNDYALLAVTGAALIVLFAFIFL